MYEFSINYTAHAHNAWLKKAVWDLRVCYIIPDKMKVDVVNIGFDTCLEYKSAASRVAEGEQWEGFMGGPIKTAIKF